jgi:hypothetical protein
VADDIIKSFLVRIGYKHDEVALKKVTEGISFATKAVFAFGAAITTAASTVFWGVSKIAANLEQLYFIALRTGSSATQLEAFELAARRMGAQAGSGLAAVESLAAFFRNNPEGMGAKAIETWFPSVTVNEKDPVKTLVSIGKAMQTMDYYQAKFRANAIGLSDEQVWYLRQPGLESMLGQMQQGLGDKFNKAAEDAHKFENSLQLLEVRLEAFGAQVVDVLQNKFGLSLDKLSAWLDKNGERLTTSIVKGLESLFAEIQKLAPKLEWLLDKLIALDKATDGWSTVILALVVAFPGLTASIIGLGTAFAGFATGAAALGLAALAAVLGPLALIVAAGGIGAVVGSSLTNLFPNMSNALGGKFQTFAEWFSKLNQKYTFGGQSNNAAKADWLMEQFQNLGWSKSQSSGWVSNAFSESTFNPNAVNEKGYKGLFQWSPERWKHFELFAKTAGLDTSDPLAQVRFADYEARHGTEQAAGKLLLATQNAESAGTIISSSYERHGNKEEDERRGAQAVQFYYDSTIHIDGSQEPQAVARYVSEAQERAARNAAAEVTREFASVVQ